jgi:antitoxin component of MazEF toxin-antitoxin module
MADGAVPRAPKTVKVIRMGDDLGVEIPLDVAASLGISEGNLVDVQRDPDGSLSMRKKSADELYAALESMRGLVPADYRFKRSDAYDAE